MTAFEFLTRAQPFEARADATPTALLTYVAGAHAAALARLWPAPHLDFFALPAARRHLAAIALARLRPDEGPALRGLLERAPLRDALAFAVSPTPRGLARALDRAGEPLWTYAGYDMLLALLAEANANLVLRHAPAIDAELVERLGALPAPLRVARIAALVARVDAARALADAWRAARWINPRRPERDVVLAWSRAADPVALLRMAIDAMKPDRFAGMAPAPEMGRPFRRLVSRAALEATALRFRNCAADYLWNAAADDLALYVWETETPALIALKRDVGGWRFAEALAPANYALPDNVLWSLVETFERAGVRPGPPVRAIEDRLDSLVDAMGATAPPVYPARAALGLGQLWR
jgi:hypothetical protein